MSIPTDPVLVEVIRNELESIIEEMSIVIYKTGRSQMVRIGDFAAVLFDGKGRLVAQGETAPLQLPTFTEVMSHLVRKWGGRLEAGDVLLTNDPYTGMGHLPDVGIITPCFWRDHLVAYTFVYSHHADIGGRFPGGISSECREIFEEGLRVPIVKLYEQGRRNEALLETMLANVRAPEVWLGDIEAKVAGCWKAEQQMKSTLDKHGVGAFESCNEYLMDYAERAAREAIGAIPDGHYIHEALFEDDGFGGPAALKIRVDLHVQGERLTADFSGTSPQVDSAINVPLGTTKGMVIAALRVLASPEILLNSGFVRPIRLIAPTGSLVNPNPPAAVGGRGVVALRVCDAVSRALAQALPDKMLVAGEAGDLIHFSGVDQEERQFMGIDSYYGGWGGRPTKDGIDGVAPIHFGGFGGSKSVELLEREYPLMVEGFGFVSDTGGPGKYRGSLSIYRQWRFLAPTKLIVRTGRMSIPSEGLNGGGAGALPTNILYEGMKRVELPRRAHLHLEVKPGDRLYHMISGSGGHGDPRERDSEKVLADVRAEKVSIGGAREAYGVIIDPETLTIDWEATQTLRVERRESAIADREVRTPP